MAGSNLMRAHRATTPSKKHTQADHDRATATAKSKAASDRAEEAKDAERMRKQGWRG